jgi:hypothetical protein
LAFSGSPKKGKECLPEATGSIPVWAEAAFPEDLVHYAVAPFAVPQVAAKQSGDAMDNAAKNRAEGNFSVSRT